MEINSLKFNIESSPNNIWVKLRRMTFVVVQMPHESTVEHDTTDGIHEEMPPRITPRRTRNSEDLEPAEAKKIHLDINRRDSTVPHLRAETPRKVTHHHDEDDSDNEFNYSPSRNQSGDSLVKMDHMVEEIQPLAG